MAQIVERQSEPKKLASALGPMDGYVPFLKWAGGKRWLAQHWPTISPPDVKRYIEPFLGGGAMFFAAQPPQAILGDLNADLINCYKAIKRDQASVFERLVVHAKHHREDFYYRIRAENPSDSIDRAARFLYLNRACFNGIYRVNLKGVFNVPKGDKATIIFPYDNFYEVAKRLRKASLVVSDFEALVDKAETGDFCFCDPPYTVTHNLNGFIKYNEDLFSWSHQLRLRDALVRADKRGARLLLTNADHEDVRALYAESGFRCHSVFRASVISGAKAARGRYREVLITNYPIRIEISG